MKGHSNFSPLLNKELNVHDLLTGGMSIAPSLCIGLHVLSLAYNIQHEQNYAEEHNLIEFLTAAVWSWVEGIISTILLNVCDVSD